MIENKLPDISSLVKKTDIDSKFIKIESKTRSINGLATNFALNAVENKIPDVNSLVKKTDYYAKILDIEKKSLIMIMINTLLLQNLIN